MANTKNLDRKERKLAKRIKRREFKAKISALTKREHKELRKFEGTSHQFMAAKEEEKKKAKAAAAAKSEKPEEKETAPEKPSE